MPRSFPKSSSVAPYHNTPQPLAVGCSRWQPARSCNKALYEVQIGRGSVGVWNGSPDYLYCPYTKYTISLFEDI